MEDQNVESSADEFPYVKRNEEGLLWDWRAEMWVTLEQYREGAEHREKFRQIVGSAEECAALNRYEHGMGF